MTTIREDSLAQIIADIRATVATALDDARESGEVLEDVERVVVTGRDRIGRVRGKTVWAIPAPWTPRPDTIRLTTHDISFSFVAMVKNDDPEAGREQAVDLISRVYDVILEVVDTDYVEAVVPGVFDPNAKPVNGSKTLYHASADLSVRVRRRE